MKGLRFIFLIICITSLPFLLAACPEEAVTINQTNHLGDGTYSGWVRFAGNTDPSVPGTYDWTGDLTNQGISTIYVASGIAGFAENPDMCYIVVAPGFNQPKSSWHKICQKQILADLEAAKVANPKGMLAEIVAAGDQKKVSAGQAPTSFTKEGMQSLAGLLPAPKAVSTTSRKATTWGNIKKKVE